MKISQLAMTHAARAWCQPATSHLEMNTLLAVEFAKILDGVWSQPWLGNATTEELLNELRTRIEMESGGLDYKTVQRGDLREVDV